MNERKLLVSVFRFWKIVVYFRCSLNQFIVGRVYYFEVRQEMGGKRMKKVGSILNQYHTKGKIIQRHGINS